MKREWLRSPLRHLRRAQPELAADVDDEIEFHLAMRTQKLMRSGMSEADAARRARAEFGDAAMLRRELIVHDGRRERRRRLRDTAVDLRLDVRLAWRALQRAPGFTAVALGTLVLGIGASVAMFAVLNAVVLRPLPYPDADRLVHVWPGQNFNMALAEAVGEGTPSIESWSGLSGWGLTLTGAGDAAQLNAQVVHHGWFDVLRVRPQIGRGFTEAERDPAESDVVIISDELWRGRFGGERDVIGRRIALDGYGHRTREVVGVMPRGFMPPFSDASAPVHLWIPLHVPPGRTVATDSTWYVNNVIARLRSGATVADASAEVSRLLPRIRSESGNIISEDATRAVGARELRASIVGETGARLWLLLGAVALVVLLMCVNLANLLLARGARRQAELATRAALGATRARLIRELLTESVILAVVGSAGGVVAARIILDLLSVASSSGLPRAAELSLDLRVTAFAVVIAAASLVLFALLPALRVTGSDPGRAAGAGRRTAGLTPAARRLGATLMAAEVAFAMLLVTAAALLISSFRSARSVDSGMDTSDVVAIRIAPVPSEYGGERAVQLHDMLLARLAQLPGVSGAGAIHLLPFTDDNWDFPYLAEGHQPPADGPLPGANFRVVTPGYFESVDVPLLSGRMFDSSDGPDAATGLINRTLAERLWPGEDAVGREIRVFGSIPFRVIGVVGDVHQHRVDAEPRPEMYRPMSQWPLSSVTLMIESLNDDAALIEAIRDEIAAVDPDIPIVDARPLDEVLGESLAQRRFFAHMLSFFGALALVLGGVGVYGVMLFAVGTRTSEYGVRMALGATHRDIMSDALRSGLVPVVLGLAGGTVAALAAARLLGGMLYGVRPHDPSSLLSAAAVLAAVSLLATWLPARRLRSVQPVSTLRGG